MMEVVFFTKFLKGLDVEAVGRTAKRLGFDGLDLAIREGQCVVASNIRTVLPGAVAVWKSMGLSVPLATGGL